MLLTLFGLLMLRIGIAGYGKYGFLVFVPSIILLGLACFGWIVTLMTKITITKDGLIFRRYFSLHFINIPYDFEDIRKIKVKWKFVSIKYKRVVLTAPRHLLIANQREFVQVIEKYAPDKIDIR
jgi:hypothetical protein